MPEIKGSQWGSPHVCAIHPGVPSLQPALHLWRLLSGWLCLAGQGSGALVGHLSSSCRCNLASVMLQLLAMKVPNVLTFDFMSKPSQVSGVFGKWAHRERDCQWAPHSRPSGTLLYYSCIYLFLAVLDLCCCAGFSPELRRGEATLVAVVGLLIAAASCCRAQSIGARAQ